MDGGFKAEGSQDAQSSKYKIALIGRLQPLLVKPSQLHNLKYHTDMDSVVVIVSNQCMILPADRWRKNIIEVGLNTPVE